MTHNKRSVALDRVTLNEFMASGTHVTSSPYTCTDTTQVHPASDGGEQTWMDGTPTVTVISHVKENERDRDAGEAQTTLTFSMKNCTLPLANLLRRLILTEVPTMALDCIIIEENDGVVFDEALGHRMGLIPIYAPAHLFEFISDMTVYDALDSAPAPNATLRFTLDVVGTTDAPMHVYSRDLVWEMLPGQEHLLAYNIGPVNRDIALAKLGKGQRIKLRAYAVKGIGLTHAKWSPVSCASYKMRPLVTLNPAVVGAYTDEQAAALVSLCPMGVFGRSASGGVEVQNAEACTTCRQCLRETESRTSAAPVTLQKDKNDLIFTVESIGQMDAPTIVQTALQLFAERCVELKKTLLEAEVKTI